MVRIEVATAVRRAKPLIPVLVEGARKPAETVLPNDLKPLARHQAVELTDQRGCQNVQQLLTALAGRIWWRKLPLSGAGVLQVASLGLWIYAGLLDDTLSRAKAQGTYIRDAYIQKLRSGADECMAGIWPEGAVKGRHTAKRIMRSRNYAVGHPAH